MAIKLDRSEVSGILVTCTECPYWFAFHFEPLDAYTASEGHQARVHDVPPEVAARPRLEYQRRLRHAARS